MVPIPDKIFIHNPLFCKHFGISHLPAEMVEKRQVVEIPPIKPVYIEHQAFARTHTCRFNVTNSFLPEITPGIGYDKSVESLSAYFNAHK